jgi:hypothetical protein
MARMTRPLTNNEILKRKTSRCMLAMGFSCSLKLQVKSCRVYAINVPEVAAVQKILVLAPTLL